MNTIVSIASVGVGLVICSALIACSPPQQDDAHGHADAAEEIVQGPHGGRLLVDGAFAVELAIFEAGVPPEFRAWVTEADSFIAPDEIDLEVTLARLGGVEDRIAFSPHGEYLRGNTVVDEPHSFVVTLKASHDGKSHRWTYDQFEGRTRIDPDMARTFGLETEPAGAATIREVAAVYGRVVPNRERVRAVSARFAGTVQSVEVAVGDRVERGQTLARVESNESLQAYAVSAPISGVLTDRNVNPGEQTADRTLFTIIDPSSVWVELAVFPADRAKLRVGMNARIVNVDDGADRQGEITQIGTLADPNQSVVARVVLDNTDGAFVPGTLVKGELHVAEHAVPLAVKRSGLQSFRDFTVVFAKVENDYEVRVLELGRQDDEWIEVLGGLVPGTRYVTTNSYLVKADIEKVGAGHEH